MTLNTIDFTRLHPASPNDSSSWPHKVERPRFLIQAVVINVLQPHISRGAQLGQSDKHKYPLDNDTYLLVGIVPIMKGDTKTAILDAAQELIQRRGVNAMSYHDISEAIGIRKASIHHHFPTKDALLDALIQRYTAYFLGLVDSIVKSKKNPAEQLLDYAGLFEATLSEGKQDKACLCGMLGAELSSLGSPAAAGVKRFYRENEARLVRILEEGKAQGQFHFKGEAKLVAAMIFSLLEGGALVARAEGGHKRLHAMVEQTLKLLLR